MNYSLLWTIMDNKVELLRHLRASLIDAQKEGGATLLVGAGISVSAGIPTAYNLMKIAIENFPSYFNENEIEIAKSSDLSELNYNEVMTKLSNTKRKELFKWFIEGNKEKGIKKAKLNFAHIAIAELFKQGYFNRILTVNFDPLLIHACYMVGMYPLPAIYDVGAMGKVNAELLHDPSIVYLNGQHVGFIQRNTTDQLKSHKETLQQIVRSTGCTRTWIIAGYSGENDPLMDALKELRPFNNWLYWLEYKSEVLQKESHQFLEKDEECKVIYDCDSDKTFMDLAEALECDLNFIERPHLQLELYEKAINFSTAGKKQHDFTISIQNYKKVLKRPELFKRLKNVSNTDIAMITEGLIEHLKYLLDQPNNKLLHEMIKTIQLIENELNVDDPIIKEKGYLIPLCFLEGIIKDYDTLASSQSPKMILKFIQFFHITVERIKRNCSHHLKKDIVLIKRKARATN